MLCLDTMNYKESQARKNLKRLRAEVDLKRFPEIGKIADSLERLIEGAAKGGDARAKKLSKKRRREIATKAARARWDKQHE